MNRLWQILLGIDRSPGSVVGDGTRLEFAALPKGLAAVGLIVAVPALVALLWWLYRREARELRRGRRVAMVALRGVVLLALVAMLVEPVLITSRTETVRSRLAMVFDDSESMKFSDPYTDESKAAGLVASLKIPSEGGKPAVDRLRETPRLDLVKSALTPNLEALGQGRDLYTYDLESASRAAPDLSAKSRKLESLKANRSVSPVGDAIAGVLSTHRGQPVAGLILATDGRSNAGEDPLRAAEAAVRQGIPIFAIAAGADEGPRNLRLAEIEASPVVFVRDPMTLGVVVEARGLKDAEATVVLEQRVNDKDWTPVGTQRVVLGEDGILKRSTFRITPKEVGQHEFRARVEDAGPELTLEDNTATAQVKVVRQQIRLLMIAGEPSPEVQFLRNALMRDQHVDFAAWLQDSDPGYRQAGDRPITRLPNNQEELNKYDALLLVDPDMVALGPQWPEMITKFVGQEGGGLIFVAGELHSQQLFEAADAKSAAGDWTRILPVVREPGLFRTEAEARLSSLNTYTLELTPEGKGDPIFEFAGDPIRNRVVLGSLPGMYWSFPVTRARPGATVLARHGDPRMQNQHGRHVLLASQLYGPGRTAFIGFDSTYRWRYLSEDNFDGFWARLVDRVGRNKALGGRFPFDVHLGKSVYRVGDQVTIGVRYGEAAAIAEAAGLAAELEIAGQPPEPLRFDRSAEDPALLTATFPAEQAGAYTLRIVSATSADAGAAVKPSVTTFRVEPPRREIDEPALNRPLLTDLARLTGGRVLELGDLKQLDEAISMREVTRTLENRDELWDSPILFSIIVLGLTGEWILRKLSRMV
ncbi:vWA domain-containing protein [Tundrisphaera lichenicola]|uniref:vWA domain-containing protein n=1 Tax=Tundrisphaera lichenicola TaxID=2029860 RepID=UPI003EC12C1E